MSVKWEPNLSAVPVIKGSGENLVIAMRILYQAGYRHDLVIHDETGNIAYTYEKAKVLLVAKEYIYGNVVSCHLKLVQLAIKKKFGIVMYIGDIRRFYRFDPEQIAQVGVPNVRGKYEFYNFPIILGDALTVDIHDELVREIIGKYKTEKAIKG